MQRAESRWRPKPAAPCGRAVEKDLEQARCGRASVPVVAEGTVEGIEWVGRCPGQILVTLSSRVRGDVPKRGSDWLHAAVVSRNAEHRNFFR